MEALAPLWPLSSGGHLGFCEAHCHLWAPASRVKAVNTCGYCNWALSLREVIMIETRIGVSYSCRAISTMSLACNCLAVRITVTVCSTRQRFVPCRRRADCAGRTFVRATQHCGLLQRWWSAWRDHCGSAERWRWLRNGGYFLVTSVACVSALLETVPCCVVVDWASERP